MDFSNIEIFLAIVETQSITKAAELLHLAQSTVSQKLKALERDLNTELIIRKKGHRRIELTTKGKDFISIAQRWSSLHKDISDFHNKKSERSLSIGCVDTLNVFTFSSLYKEIAKKENNMILQIRTHQSIEIYNLLENHEIDIGFVLRESKTKNVIVEKLFSEKMYLIRCGDNLDTNKVLEASQLNFEDEIFLNWSPEYEFWHNQYCDSNIKPHVHVDTVSLILNFLDSPKYWAILPESIINEISKYRYINIFSIDPPPPNRECYLLTHKYPKPQSISNIDFFKKNLKKFIFSTLDIK